jgi:hypothetical protein
MGGWPELARLIGSGPNISPYSRAGWIIGAVPTSPASGTWATADLAIFHPIRLAMPVVVSQFWVVNGATVADNFDIGVYSLDGTLIASTGSTVQAGTNAVQSVDVADFTIGPGGFYLAIVFHDITSTTFGSAPNLATSKMLGMAQMAAAFPLPAVATLATTVSYRVPIYGMSTRVTI